MSLLKGSAKVTFCIVNNTYSSVLDRAKANAAIDIESAKSYDYTMGLASGRVLLDSNITPENSKIGDYEVLNLRQTTKKIDSSMLKAMIQEKEAEWKKRNNFSFTPTRVRNELKEECIEKLNSKAILAVKGVEIIFTKNFVIICSTNEKEVALCLNHITDLGVEVQVVSLGQMRERLEFLTLLSLNRISINIPVSVEGPLDLIYLSRGENDSTISYCTKAKIEGSTVNQSIELSTLISQGKLIQEAKITIGVDEETWKFTFDASNWTFSSISLPKSCEDFNDRVHATLKLNSMMADMFKIFKSKEEVK